MLAIAFRFPAGRYHATPWGRHVNEAVVAWPPEPWRVLRALISTWHHKVKPMGKYDLAILTGLIETLAQTLPEYKLPAASHSHTRHYMPAGKPSDKPLIFDAFAAISPTDPLIMAWPNLELTGPQLALLDELLATVGYLGRAESWVDAERVEGDFEANCYPVRATITPPAGKGRTETIELLAANAPDTYAKARQRLLTNSKPAKKISKTLPPALLEAISLETSSLRKPGWSQPPASRKAFYLRPANALRPRHALRLRRPATATTARFLLIGRPLPRVEQAIRIGELFRRAIMSEARRTLGEDAIPPALSGHDLPSGNLHRHAFYLPWDENGDGRIDRLILHVPEGMDAGTFRVQPRLKRLWGRSGEEWALALENLAGADAGGPLLASASDWISVTPYLHPWHLKRNLNVEAQIRRECSIRQIPEPVELTQLPAITLGVRMRRTIDFRRFREKRDQRQPDRLGSFWRIRFARPLPGPLALGFGCHFGLGLFRPDPPKSHHG